MVVALSSLVGCAVPGVRVYFIRFVPDACRSSGRHRNGRLASGKLDDVCRVQYFERCSSYHSCKESKLGALSAAAEIIETLLWFATFYVLFRTVDDVRALKR